MTLTVTHAFVSAIPDDADTSLVRPSNWNAAHTVTGTIDVADITGTVPATAGGTGLTSYAVGDIVYAATTTTLAKLADVATGNALISGGVGTAPSWGKIALATAVSGNLPVANLNSGTNADNTHFWRGDGTWAVPASGGTPGGASLTLQYNNASAFGGMSGTSWDDTNRSLTITGATVTTSKPVLNMTQTWNNAATVFTGLKFNATNTASDATSLLIDLQASTVSRFNITPSGITTFALPNAATTPSFYFNTTSVFCADTQSLVWGRVGVSTFASSAKTVVLYADTARGAVVFADEFAFNGQTGDTHIVRAGANQIQFGLQDAATATAQTLQVQSVVAGNGNVAGADWTFVGSKSNGSGAGGNILFNLSQNTAASGSQNTTIQALKIGALGTSVGGGCMLQVGSGSTTNTGFVFGAFDAAGTSGIWSTAVTPSSSNYTILFSSSQTWLQAPSNSILNLRVNGTNVMELRSGNVQLTPSTTTFAWGTDLTLMRPAAATLQFGAADAATAVAQTTQVQSVVAGNGNVAGADWTFVGSKSNGSGAGGAIIFNLSQSSAGSGSQNTAIQVLKIIPPGGNAGQTSIQIGSGSSSTTGWIMGYSGFSGFPGLWPTSVTPTNSNMCLSASTTSTTVNVPSGGTVDFRIANTVAGTFLSTSAFQFGAADAATATAQTTQVQSVVAGTASGTAGADWTFIGSSGTGVGVGGDFIFKTRPAGGASTSQNAPVEKFRIASAGQVTIANTLKITSGHLDMVSPGALIYFADDTNIFLDGNGRYQFPHSTGGISAHTGGVADSWIRSPAAATWQFGTFDAAAPIAQTVSIQSVVAGTANGTAGVDWIFKTSSGTGTGTGGNFILKTPFSAKSSGTGQGTWVDRDIYVSKGKVLTSATPVSLFEIALPAGAMAGGTIYSTIICTNGTDMQSFSQSVSYSVVNKAGAYTKSITAATGDKSVTGASTLTTTWTLLDGTNKSTVQVSATTSLTPSTNAFICYYSMANNSEQATTIL